MSARRITSSLSFLATALMLGLSTFSAHAQVVAALSVSPNPAPANKAFTLTLNGVTATCNTVFSRESVSVYSNRVDLRYTAESRIIIDPPIIDVQPAKDIPPICPVYADPQPAGGPIIEPPAMLNAPTFQMPAMKPGKYEVWATAIPACAYSKPACLIKIAPVAAGTLEVTEGISGITYTVTPSAAAAGKEFELHLLSYGFNCGTTFDNLSVDVTGNVITVSFLDHEHAGIMCPAIYMPYGPTFKIPALSAGTYKVKAYRHPACLPCKMLGEIADAGSIVIQGTVMRKGWFLKEHTQLAGKAFDMQLLNLEVGNCATSFSHQSVTQNAGGIYTSFLLETFPDRVCIQDMRPFGPTFAMQALKVGVYPIYVTQLAACEVTAPFCAIDRLAPVASDTLVVMSTLAVRISELRAHAPRVSLHGNTAEFALPKGRTGAWRAELVTVEGRVLGDRTVNGSTGDRVELNVGRAPANAVSLLRLTSPEGIQQFLPIVRH